MKFNPVLKELGFAPGDRVVVLHADDVGICQASVDAFAALAEQGPLSAGSVMVPCPAFSAAAALCRARPGIDAGVHLTLTCEWRRRRWKPVAAAGPQSGLVDAAGRLHRERGAAVALAGPAAVEREIAAQLDAALAAGIEVTHLDSHMFALISPRLVAAYVRLARRRRLPALLWRPDPASRRFSEESAVLTARRQARWRAQGLPVFDRLDALPLRQPGQRLAQVERWLARLPPGLSQLILHPAVDSPELRSLTRDWRGRVADYELLRGPHLARLLLAHRIQVIGYRPLRAALRRTAAGT
ncbi:MAG TPA: ChbG/HpnK family deacetylase [Thermoanaerobaculia bacterium]|nr:ChbG/HpnK family deacetylase [Thermoanaerobaculia bacterium]